MVAGAKLEDKLLVGNRLTLSGNTGAVSMRGDAAYGVIMEATLREKSYPVGQGVATLGASLVKWHKEYMFSDNVCYDNFEFLTFCIFSLFLLFFYFLLNSLPVGYQLQPYLSLLQLGKKNMKLDYNCLGIYAMEILTKKTQKVSLIQRKRGYKNKGKKGASFYSSFWVASVPDLGLCFIYNIKPYAKIDIIMEDKHYTIGIEEYHMDHHTGDHHIDIRADMKDDFGMETESKSHNTADYGLDADLFGVLDDTANCDMTRATIRYPMD
ncbi:hypothetical protein ACJX0J_023021, partial [Zea mays]